MDYDPDGRPGWALLFANRGWDVYVVDWPGVGRSGTRPENLADTPADLVNALALLLERTGPSVLVGHSIGAAVALKLTERHPESIRAVAALAPASVESVGSVVPPSPLDEFSGTTREGARQRFANSAKFPEAAFDRYFASLVLYGPRIHNAAIGLTDELKLDRSKTGLWNKRVPTLVLAADDDMTVPASRMAETTRVMGVPMTMLGRNWSMPGHGHLFIVELESEAIAGRVEEWLAIALRR
ncbi:alpha/beta hydrolase [Cupriavidus alkaliphilus]|uniref:alpha/beta hydrolase n=1 Tax=Cupriavidus alkaliphilus TaxID=942866 RepID=UPI001619F3CD|nr:alpha/beta fold hydrolase [Cupriavidus alkaliphilus]MBB3014165.1 pimeloyl-ACP methyl ester carboxylesterase [Cupriavidus alkaliphilus]